MVSRISAINSGIMFSPKTQRKGEIDQLVLNNRKRGSLEVFLQSEKRSKLSESLL